MDFVNKPGFLDLTKALLFLKRESMTYAGLVGCNFLGVADLLFIWLLVLYFQGDILLIILVN